MHIVRPTCDIELVTHDEDKTSALCISDFCQSHFPLSGLHSGLQIRIITSWFDFLFLCVQKPSVSVSASQFYCVFTAKLYAIRFCIFVVKTLKVSTFPHGLPDPLQTAHSCGPDHQFTMYVLCQMFDICKARESLVFCWVPVIHACPEMRRLVQLLRRLPPMGTCRQNKFSALTFVLMFIAQFYHSGRKKWPPHRTAVCGQ
jgi:hypothetical protein